MNPNWIDATLPLRDGMPVWPGDPKVSLRRIAVESGEYRIAITELGLSTHSGTHVDAPSHFLPHGSTLDSVPLDIGLGPCRVIDVRDATVIEPLHLARCLIRHGASTSHALQWPQDAESDRPHRLVLKTGASERMLRGEFPRDYAALSPEAARAIVEAGVRLLGIDAPSVGAFHDPGPVHEILLSAGVILLESLLLTNVPPGHYDMIALPLRIEAADGSPARVLLRAISAGNR